MMAIAVVDVVNSRGRVVAIRNSDDVIAWQRKFSAALRRVAEPGEPAVFKFIGDGCLAVFEGPVTAITFLRDVQVLAVEMGVETRSGIEIGRVELYEGDVAGLAAFVASELCGRAQPGQIVGSRTVVDLTGVPAAVSLGITTLRATGNETELFAL
jgi:class 3 adenylate cyclase